MAFDFLSLRASIFEKDADNVGKQKKEEQAFKMDRPFVTPCLLNQTKQ